jgi:hypothetical protein
LREIKERDSPRKAGMRESQADVVRLMRSWEEDVNEALWLDSVLKAARDDL